MNTLIAHHTSDAAHLSTTLGLGTIGWPQMIVLGLLGVLLFGKRLPEVGKSLGKGIVEFKKGLSGIDTELDDIASSPDGKKLEANSSAAPPTATESRTADVQSEAKAE